MRKLVEARKKRPTVKERRRRARLARETLSAKGQDTSEPDKTFEQADREYRALRTEIAQLRVSEALLALLDGTPWAHAPGSMDEARLREFERQLADGLENELQLAAIERALDAMDPSYTDGQHAVLDEARDVDEILREWEELLQQRPSPERGAGFQSSYERLQRELREERDAVEGAVAALANEYANIQTTQAGSSSGPSWQQRLLAIHREQLQLRAQWRARLEDRLGRARRQLDLIRSVERLRDEAVEAELAREIALLDRELQNAG
jgi:hypothetical protein